MFWAEQQRSGKPMDRTSASDSIRFSRPVRQIFSMLLVCVLVVSGAWLIHDTVIGIIRTNGFLNLFITGVFVLGVITCFWQVFILMQSVTWIERFVRHDPTADESTAPTLLAPLAALLKSRGARMQISASSSRSILESVATRIDEARDITRYLANLLVFLGLLGTFFGLATTVPAVVETIRSLAPQEGESGLQVFEKLMGGLESQLGGMGTAFSSSLLGLAGSLVVGLLELFAGHGQNRFYRELEEWLSSITRLGFAGPEGDGGEAGPVSAVLDHLAAQVEVLQTLIAQSEANRAATDQGLSQLTAAINKLARMATVEQGQVATMAGLAEAQTETLTRIAEGQENLVAALTGEDSRQAGDAESRMRLRSIDVGLLRVLEEMAAGRQEALADLRTDLAALTAAVRQLSRGR